MADPERDNEERLFNFLVFKLYLTNAEIEEAAPLATAVIIVILVVMFGVWLFL